MESIFADFKNMIFCFKKTIYFEKKPILTFLGQLKHCNKCLKQLINLSLLYILIVCIECESLYSIIACFRLLFIVKTLTQ